MPSPTNAIDQTPRPLGSTGVAIAILAAVVALASAACGRTDLDSGGPVGGGGASGGGGRGGSVGGILTLPPSPGVVLCGSEVCVPALQQCCLGVGTSGSLAAHCQSMSTSCVGASLQCDEPADCGTSSNNNVCCFGLLTSGTSATGQAASPASTLLGSRCTSRSGCSGVGKLILCRVNSDCGAGTVCCPGLGEPTCQTSCTSL